MAYFIRSSYATFLRNWLVLLRAYRWSFFISGFVGGICSIVLAFLTYYLLAGGQIDSQFSSYAGTADYMSYLILGSAILSFSISILLGISRSLITERREGTLESLLLAPMQRFYYFAGITVQWTLNCLAETVLLLLIVWPFGLKLASVNLITLVLAFPVALLGLFGMSVVLGALMLATGDTYVSQNTLFAAMTLLGGFLFPVGYLPLPLQWLSMALPVTGAVKLLRAALLTGAAPSTVATDLMFYALLGCIYALAGLWLMPGAERQALEGVH